jgi:DNA-binding transcriptional MerR regulator
VNETWTLPELVAEAAARIEALPPPKNRQVRAVPDDRTIRYYGTIGLLDKPAAMRGRTALYSRRHLAQVVAIKRLQGADHSLADIQRMWPTLDDHTLARMTNIQIGAASRGGARTEFWKRDSIAKTEAQPLPSANGPLEVRIALAANLTLTVGLADNAPLSLTPADVRALRAAAAPLVSELANRGLAAQVLGTLLEEP